MMPWLLNYCSPEAAFILEEVAGTPFVPMQSAMKKLNAYDYWPDICRELARATATTYCCQFFLQLIGLSAVIILFNS